MPTVCMYFQVHQPYRLRRYPFFDIGGRHDYVDLDQNHRILDKVAEKCYLPTNRLLLHAIRRWEGRFRLAFSLTGVFLDQLAAWRPDVLEGFQRLAETGCVEILGETSHHSLAYLFSSGEFRRQVQCHRNRIRKVFGQDPVVFRHTELLYDNGLAREAQEMGFRAVLAEGAPRLLGDRDGNAVYRAWSDAGLPLLLRNARLSDDIAFRFSNRDWPGYPLTAGRYASWIHEINGPEALVNLFMDYETFGEHQWRETGIFTFLEQLPGALLERPSCVFATPSEAACLTPAGTIDCPETVSWADVDRGSTAWLGNAMQQDAARTLYALEEEVNGLGDEALLETWRRLQTSDHFYYMCTNGLPTGTCTNTSTPIRRLMTPISTT